MTTRISACLAVSSASGMVIKLSPFDAGTQAAAKCLSGRVNPAPLLAPAICDGEVGQLDVEVHLHVVDGRADLVDRAEEADLVDAEEFGPVHDVDGVHHIDPPFIRPSPLVSRAHRPPLQWSLNALEDIVSSPWS